MLLSVENLHKSFGGLKAVNGVSFNIKKGEIVGLIGPNGAGKTTLFNLVAGYYKPDEGRIKFNGENITNLRAHEVAERGICRTFQLVKAFKDIVVLENILLGALLRTDMKSAREEALRELDFVGLSEKKNVLAGELTVVDQKRLEIARALCTNPKLLMFDEVMAGLNPREMQDALELITEIHQRGITLFLTEHVMKAIMTISDRIIVLDKGCKIAEGKPKNIAKDKRVIQAYLGTRRLKIA